MSTKATTTPKWRAADLGALNGHSNARGVLDVLRVIPLGGEAGGHRLLSQKTIDRIFDVQADGWTSCWRRRSGSASAAATPPRPCPTRPRGGWRGGWGGSMAVMDLDRRLTITYMMNKMGAGSWGPNARSPTSAPCTPRWTEFGAMDLDDVVPVADHVTRQARVIDARRPWCGRSCTG